ncbi:MAG TPA: hypothetical protein VJ553_01065 [Candidatus Paceibacterota bacterium]|nr:hypothetical protein [Candidatus Paceibacterota bacterium]
MPTMTQIKSALWDWIETAVVGTDAAGRTIFDSQGKPRPERPYADISIDSIASIGPDERRPIDDDGDRRITGTRIARVMVQTYGTDALQLAETIRSSLMLKAVLSALRIAGLVFLATENVQDITALLDTDYEERAAVEVRFAFVSDQTENVGWIETVEGEYSYEKPDGTVVLEDDFSVDIEDAP